MIDNWHAAPSNSCTFKNQLMEATVTALVPPRIETIRV